MHFVGQAVLTLEFDHGLANGHAWHDLLKLMATTSASRLPKRQSPSHKIKRRPRAGGEPGSILVASCSRKRLSRISNTQKRRAEACHERTVPAKGVLT